MKNLRRVVPAFIITAVLVGISATGCSVKPAQHLFRPLTNAETRAFIKDNNINALATKNFKEATIVLYETRTEQGNYALAYDEGGKFQKQQYRTSYGPPKTIVSFDDGLDFGTIIINDKKLLKAAYKITVQFASGDTFTEMVNGRKAFIVPHEKTKNSNAGIESVSISDERDRVLYEH